ncbi:MAG: glutamate formiminotransferase / 5-formyltetrahydrofolate cyclo-ligase [Candidatus Thermoplasmatota archaeon]|nr:glutamate formiminotransferase / 5-formyltetrahydrofolate cyclo-ligase [Candidatus Thermoplasmatota archaeon]
MAAVIECVPNFSEGRRKDVVDGIVHSIRSVPGTKVLDVEMDPDHNRSVVTFTGSKESVQESAFRGARAASELIDLTKHKGEHPRMGALDVLPFIPISGATMEDCVEIANKVGSRIARHLKIPVYLYEAAAKRPDRKNLEVVRRGQFEGLREAILTDDSRYPDYGPRAVHPTAGATAVGARMPLVAFNVNLRSEDVEVAKAIAKKIRTSGGGLPCVKALGFHLSERKMVQVSMNLTDYTVTPISKVFLEVMKEAEGHGVEVAESEIIGLIPLDAVCDLAGRFLRIPSFASSQVLERRIWC